MQYSLTFIIYDSLGLILYLHSFNDYKGFNDFFLVFPWNHWHLIKMTNRWNWKFPCYWGWEQHGLTQFLLLPTLSIFSTLVLSSIPTTPSTAAIPPILQMKRWLTLCRQGKTRFHKLGNLFYLFQSLLCGLWEQRCLIRRASGG